MLETNRFSRTRARNPPKGTALTPRVRSSRYVQRLGKKLRDARRVRGLASMAETVSRASRAPSAGNELDPTFPTGGALASHSPACWQRFAQRPTDVVKRTSSVGPVKDCVRGVTQGAPCRMPIQGGGGGGGARGKPPNFGPQEYRPKRDKGRFLKSRSSPKGRLGTSEVDVCLKMCAIEAAHRGKPGLERQSSKEIPAGRLSCQPR